ncbi:MBL fold metallo-hydrolase [Maridesulfovibrio ferrireducens]|uniref:MBL fold metallo-hydrolase n=1 Tax=Maridesulfovibrio ferrireducens TaxID=246191 RepID=UPI001A2998E6|nr:MBL fold metallo-hydrolase [Maridesulfovibrio ferrireducens]MBI9110387.1 MBL fold metallo-hydrolase [Maridesulfovibrio ferrireducens]
MKIKITYIFHNCFVLDVGKLSIVFDIPAQRFRMSRARSILEEAVCGRDVVIFFSHSHLDHFAPDYMDVCGGANSVKAVLSDDIEEMYPDIFFENALVVEPDQKYVFENLKIETLMSNDLGVAFMIETVEGVKIYNGGDLACWDWESSSEADQKFTRDFFDKAADRIAGFGSHIVFSNVDRRLESLAGGPFLVEAVKPQVFIPTHALGRTAWLEGIHERLGIESRKCFSYRRAGDVASFDILLSGS